MEQDINNHKLEINKINQRIKEFLWNTKYRDKKK